MKTKTLAAALAALLLLTGCTSAEDGVSEAKAENKTTVTAAASKPDAPDSSYSSGKTNNSDSSEISDSQTTTTRRNSGGLLGFFGLEPNTTTVQYTYTEPVTTTFDEQAYLDEMSKQYTLTVDDSGLVTRTGEVNDDLTWVIKVNGATMLERNASGEMTYRPMNYGNGVYEVYLESYGRTGYVTVSNTVTFKVPLENYTESDVSDLPEGFESDRIFTKKSNMKHLAQTIWLEIEDEICGVDYKKGFVIDPEHDGYPNGVTFYAGTTEQGERVQYLHDNDTSGLHFKNIGDETTIGVWFDRANKREYLVTVDASGTAIDLMTEKTVEGFKADSDFYTFNADAPSDRDHFIVSYSGTPNEEKA